MPRRQPPSMAMPSGSHAAERRPLRADERRPESTWLVLAADGPAVGLADTIPGVAAVVVADPARFRDLLGTLRPSVVVCSRPPAALGDLQSVIDARRRRASMRAVLISPPDAVDARLDALAEGFDDALASTVPLSELAGRLAWHDARARAQTARDMLLQFGDGLELDLAAHELRRHGQIVHLRPKEFGVLALLATHPGRVHSRAELLRRVWGTTSGSSRTVDVHVRWLRAKVEAHPDRPVTLVTVRGAGYRLDPTPR